MSTDSGSRRGLLALLWLAVAIVAVVLRFGGLGGMPFHADEAEGARLTADRLEGRGYVFDPAHHHGPALSWLASRAVGARSFAELEAAPLRAVAAGCGLLVVFFPLLLRRPLGSAGALLAGAFLATSPLLAYYSRVFIHEPVLAVAAAGVLVCLAWWLRTGSLIAALAGGAALGLMAATKETFVISAFSWLVGLAVARPAADACAWRRSLLFSVAAFFVVLVAAYGTPGAFFATYGAYATDPAHAKPAFYYANLLLAPKYRAPMWWTEAAVAAAALAGAWHGWRRGDGFLRLLAVSTAVQFLVYSALPYKTPWLMTVPWVQCCLLAGHGAAACLAVPGVRRLAAVLVLAGVLLFQTWQARAAVFRFPADARNPLAYSPTSRDAERLGARLRALRGKSPAFRAGRIAVIGRGYWPLPWYLRGTAQTGYYDELPDGVEGFAVVIAVPDHAASASASLAPTHREFWHGLRHEYPVAVYVRRDVRAEEERP